MMAVAVVYFFLGFCAFSAHTHFVTDIGLDEAGLCSVIRSLLDLPNLSTVRLDHTATKQASILCGELLTAGVIRGPVPPEVQRRGWSAVWCHVQQATQLHFCRCITQHCLHQLSVALQCRHFFHHSSVQPSFVSSARRLPRARLLRLLCYSGVFRMFVTKIVPRNNAHCLSRDNALLRGLLLRFVCSTTAAHVLCNNSKDR